MADPENQPVLVHCRSGKNRTGTVIAAYRILHQNQSLDQAQKEMYDLGFDKKYRTLEKVLEELAGSSFD